MALVLGQAANLLLNLFYHHQLLAMVYLFLIHLINNWSIFYWISDVALSLKQVDKNPVKPSSITEANLLPYKCSSTSVWKWFRLAKKCCVRPEKNSSLSISASMLCKVLVRRNRSDQRVVCVSFYPWQLPCPLTYKTNIKMKICRYLRWRNIILRGTEDWRQLRGA